MGRSRRKLSMSMIAPKGGKGADNGTRNLHSGRLRWASITWKLNSVGNEETLSLVSQTAIPVRRDEQPLGSCMVAGQRWGWNVPTRSRG